MDTFMRAPCALPEFFAMVGLVPCYVPPATRKALLDTGAESWKKAIDSDPHLALQLASLLEECRDLHHYLATSTDLDCLRDIVADRHHSVRVMRTLGDVLADPRTSRQRATLLAQLIHGR